MQRFFVSSITQEGRPYYIANYPGEQVRYGRRSPGRRQKKFASRPAAEAFLEEVRREWTFNGGVSLATDSELHYDFMRAVGVIAGLPGVTLEKAALLLKKCISPREGRDGSFEAPINRQVELDPRVFLLCQNEARRLNQSIAETVNSALMQWALGHVTVMVREREISEAEKELQGLKEKLRAKWRRAEANRAAREAARKESELQRALAEAEEEFARRKLARAEAKAAKAEARTNGNRD